MYRDGKSRISRDHSEEEKYLEILNKYFETETFEKHPDAMLNIMFTNTFDEVLGPNFFKSRISKRKEKKIKERLIKKLQSKYGRWINITNFKIKDIDHVRFLTNFNRVYKVKGLGILYGCPSERVCGGVFYTQHCLERFEERLDPVFYSPLALELKKSYGVEPTIADILVGMVMTSNFEYAQKDQFYYLNIRVGILVLKNFQDVFIVKTFLTPEMLQTPLEWFKPLLTQEQDHNPNNFFRSFSDMVNHESIKIQRPSFLLDEFEEFLEVSLNRED